MSQNMALAVSYQEFVDGVTETLNRHPAIKQTVVQEMVEMMRARGHTFHGFETVRITGIAVDPMPPGSTIHTPHPPPIHP